MRDIKLSAKELKLIKIMIVTYRDSSLDEMRTMELLYDKIGFYLEEELSDETETEDDKTK